MKRHPALRDLSADHQQGLVQARRLVQAGATAAADPLPALQVGRAFLAFCDAEIRRHFRAEEEVLLPAFARYGDPAHPAIVQMLVEHIRIRQGIADLEQQVARAAPEPATMQALGELLRAHIRYEEATIFPLLETTLPEAALRALPPAFQAASRAP